MSRTVAVAGKATGQALRLGAAAGLAWAGAKAAVTPALGSGSTRGAARARVTSRVSFRRHNLKNERIVGAFSAPGQG